MKMLIVKIDRLDRTILAMPLAQRLKDHFSNLHLTFLVLKETLPLFKNHPFVDHVISNELKNMMDLYRLWKFFKREKFDTLLYLGGSHIPSLLGRLTGIPTRAGLRSQWPSFFLLNRGIRQKRSLVEGHELEYDLHLLETLGVPYKSKDLLPGICITREETESAFKDFQKDLGDQKYSLERELFFLHPCHDNPSLSWPVKYYGFLIAKLEKIYPEKYTYIISYHAKDEESLRELRKVLDQKHFDSLQRKIYFFNVEVKGFRYHLQVLSSASFFVGSQRGMTHVACSLGLKTVVIYSPIKNHSSRRFAPLSPNGRLEILTPDAICGQYYHCSLERCPYYDCMKNIHTSEVLENICQLMELDHE